MLVQVHLGRASVSQGITTQVWDLFRACHAILTVLHDSVDRHRHA